MENKTCIPPIYSILLNVQQLGVFLGGMSQAKIYGLVSAGKIPAPKKIDSMSRWLRSEIEEWCQKLA